MKNIFSVKDKGGIGTTVETQLSKPTYVSRSCEKTAWVLASKDSNLQPRAGGEVLLLRRADHEALDHLGLGLKSEWLAYASATKLKVHFF